MKKFKNSRLSTDSRKLHTLALNEQGDIQVFHDNNRDFKSRTLFVGGDGCPVALFKSFVEQRPLLKNPCDGLFFFV